MTSGESASVYVCDQSLGAWGSVLGGTYSSAPESGHTVNLSGGGLSANFEVNKWESNTWGALVNNGSGTVNGHSINFNGGAAGTYTGGSFSGTGAGVASRPQ